MSEATRASISEVAKKEFNIEISAGNISVTEWAIILAIL